MKNRSRGTCHKKAKIYCRLKPTGFRPILLFSESGMFCANSCGCYLPAKSLGSYISGLITKVNTTDSQDPHYQLLNEFEMQKLARWVDSNYQFYGNYYGRHHGNYSADPNFRRKATYEEATSPRAPLWHQ